MLPRPSLNPTIISTYFFIYHTPYYNPQIEYCQQEYPHFVHLYKINPALLYNVSNVNFRCSACTAQRR